VCRRKGKKSFPWWKQWEKIFDKSLGWSIPEESVPLGYRWEQWEQAWGTSLKWDRGRLRFYSRSTQRKRWRQYWEQHPEVEWRFIRKGLPKQEQSDRQTALLLFYCMFLKSYATSQRKIKKNKDMNMRGKRRFIHVLFWAVLLQILLFLIFAVLLVAGISTDHMVYVEGFALICLALTLLIVAKDLDVNKYQETWSRHTFYQYQRDQEMLRFLLKLEPYNKLEDNEWVDAFVGAILRIEEQNITKFCANMENKEKGMLDEAMSLFQKTQKKQ
jgi:hypothetical protein